MKNGAPLLFYGDSYRFPDIYHSIRFLAPDPQIVLEQDGEIVMLTNSLEEGRARKQSRATKIHNVDEFGSQELIAGGAKPTDETATVIERFLASRGVTRDGATLTAERVRAIIEGALLERGCLAESTIVAPGPQAADPHMIGSGPIRSNQAVVMDIFPQHKGTRYWADMTRTVSKGVPVPEIVRMYEVVRQAQDA